MKRIVPRVSRKRARTWAVVLALAVLAGLVSAGLAPRVAAGARADARSDAVGFLTRRQVDGGGFAEAGRAPDPALTAWVVLGLAAAGRDPASLTAAGASPADYLAGKPYPTATDLELRILALDALGRAPSVLVDQLESLRRASGAIGPSVNATIWGILALRSVGRPAGSKAVSYLLRQQREDGGWSWYPGVASDSNDTAAAIQALRAAGVSRTSRAIVRGLAYLRRLQNPRRRLRAVVRPRIGRPVDRLGDPGVPGRRPHAAQGRLRLPRRAATLRRQLPLQRALRDDARLGDRPGAAGARPAAIPALSHASP